LRHVAEACVQRWLAAVLAANVVGYSRLMELGETGTLTLCERPWTMLGTGRPSLVLREVDPDRLNQ